jgi:hypothetical protein
MTWARLETHLHFFLAERDFGHKFHARRLVWLRVLEILCLQNLLIFLAAIRGGSAEVVWGAGSVGRREAT